LGYRRASEIRIPLNYRCFLREFESVPGSQFQFLAMLVAIHGYPRPLEPPTEKQAGSTTGPQAQLDADAFRGGGPERSGGFAAQPRTIRPGEPQNQ
jgi:hypothetical protein